MFVNPMGTRPLRVGNGGTPTSRSRRLALLTGATDEERGENLCKLPEHAAEHAPACSMERRLAKLGLDMSWRMHNGSCPGNEGLNGCTCRTWTMPTTRRARATTKGGMQTGQIRGCMRREPLRILTRRTRAPPVAVRARMAPPNGPATGSPLQVTIRRNGVAGHWVLPSIVQRVQAHGIAPWPKFEGEKDRLGRTAAPCLRKVPSR